MADHPSSDQLLQEVSGTPLDILLNAISGAGPQFQLDEGGNLREEGLSDDGAFDSASALAKATVPESREQIDLDSFLRQPENQQIHTSPHDGPSRPKQAESTVEAISSVIHNVLLVQPTASGAHDDLRMSSVSVWHPLTGQKSYGKERRLLNPPPTLFVNGPLADSLTYASLTTMLRIDKTTTETVTPTDSTQAHLISISDASARHELEPATKRARLLAPELRQRERAKAAKLGFGSSLAMRAFHTEQQDRAALRDGLAFPMLVIPDQVGKEKEVCLELKLGEPGIDPMDMPDFSSLQTPATPLPALEAAQQGDSSNLDHAMLQDFLAHENATEGQKAQANSQPGSSHRPHSMTPLPPAPAPPAFATFRSSPIRVIAKPSQKTNKARSMLSCLSANETVSLFTRIHGQTVRTKYMKLETDPDARLTAKSGKWSPFRFEVIQAGADLAMLPKPLRSRPSKDGKGSDEHYRWNVLTYGSIVRLEDVQSGYKTEPLKLVRVDKNEVTVNGDIGQPVSELHRVGLVRVEDLSEGQGRWYLSAPGARAGGAEVGQGDAPGSRRRPLPKVLRKTALEDEPNIEDVELDTKVVAEEQEEITPVAEEQPASRKRTQRRALARATIAEESEGSLQAMLSWAEATVESRGVEIKINGQPTKQMAQVEKVPDWMCWVITGVACSSFSFFHAKRTDSVDPSPENLPTIGKVPRLLEGPDVHDEGSRGPDVSISFAVTDPEFFRNLTGGPDIFDVYLGPHGPLEAFYWRSSCTANPATTSDNWTYTLPYDEQSDLAVGPPRSGIHCARSHIVISFRVPPNSELARYFRKGPATVSEAEVEAGADSSAPGEQPSQDLHAGLQQWLARPEQANDPAGSPMPPPDGSEFPIDPTLDNIAADHGPYGNHIDLALDTEARLSGVALLPPNRRDSPKQAHSLPLLLARRSDGLVLSLGRSWLWIDLSEASQ